MTHYQLRIQASTAIIDMVFEPQVLDSWVSGPSGLDGPYS